MLILFNYLFGERFVNFMFGLLEKMAVSFWQAAGAIIVMIIGIALCLSLVVNFTIHAGGFLTFCTSAVVGIVATIFAIKWILLFLVFGVPALIIVFGVHRAMRNRRVDPTVRGLFLWATIMLII